MGRNQYWEGMVNGLCVYFFWREHPKAQPKVVFTDYDYNAVLVYELTKMKWNSMYLYLTNF